MAFTAKNIMFQVTFALVAVMAALMPQAQAADHAALEVSLTVLSVCTVGYQGVPAAQGKATASVNVSCSSATPYRMAVSGSDLNEDRSSMSTANSEVPQTVLTGVRAGALTTAAASGDEIKHVVATVIF